MCNSQYCCTTASLQHRTVLQAKAVGHVEIITNRKIDEQSPMRLLHVLRALILCGLLLAIGVWGPSWASFALHHTTYKSFPATAAATNDNATVRHKASLRHHQDSTAFQQVSLAAIVDSVVSNSMGKLVVKNLGPVVNGDKEDFGPTITADGRTMFFVSRRDDPVAGMKGDNFWVSTSPENNDTTWSAPNPVTDINSNEADGAASIAADGQTIYFATSRNTTEKGDVNLWVATLDGRTWKNVHEVGAPINTTKFETQPSISPDGKKLYFASNRPGKIGGEGNANVDIFVSHQLPDGRWGNPVNLGSKINTGKYEGSPFMATDGTTLYFASNGKGGLGGLDLYQSEWKGPSDTDWTEPVPLPAGINSDADDYFLTVPASGNVLFFASNRAGGSGGLDLYVATNPPPPKASLVLRGIAYDVNKPEMKLGAHVIITDEQTGDTLYNKFANSATGEYLAVIPANARGELGGSFLVAATEPNHFPYPPTAVKIPVRKDTSRIITHDIPMNNEFPPTVKWVTETPEIVKQLPNKWPNFKGVVIKEQKTIELFALLPMLFFDEGKGSLPGRYVLYSSPAETNGFTEDTLSGTMNAYYNYLNIMGLRLRNNPSTTIKLVGTNSQDAADEKSVDLSRQRAESAKKYLVDIWGIQPNRITVEARNLPENATLATTPEGIQENRRVEVISDSWEIIHPVLFSQGVKVPDRPNVKFTMENGLRPEVIKSRQLVISYKGKPWATIDDLGPISQKESPEWNWRNTGTKKLPDGDDDMQVQLKITDNTGREVLSNVDVVQVRQFSQSDVVAEHTNDKTRETYNLILFPYNKSDMGKWNHKILETYVYQRIQPSSDVAVNGYTDILGTEDYNARLSSNRANAVRADIAGRIGSKVKSLNAHGFGKTQPLYTNDLPEGRYYNRTVQVLVETPINAAP